MYIANMLNLNPTNFSNLDQVVNAFTSVTTFYLEPGEYHVTNTVKINRPNVQFIGSTNDAADVHIIQDTVDKTAISVEAENVSLKFLSVHVPDGTGVCLVQKNSDWVSVQHCAFYGSSNEFAVSFLGKHSDSTDPLMDRFLNDEKNSNCVFNDNIVYSRNSNNVVSLYNQNNFSIKNNIIRGGRIMVNMSLNVMVGGNKIYDSPSNGLLINMPSQHIDVVDNVFKDCQSSSISIKPLEANLPDFPSYVVIRGNHILNSHYFGLQLEDVSDVKVENNTILWSAQFAIFLLRASLVEVRGNRCSHFSRGVVVDVESDNVIIDDNQFFNVYPEDTVHGVIIETTSTNVTINNNLFSGNFSSGAIKDVDETNSIGTNSFSQYRNYNLELTLI